MLENVAPDARQMIILMAAQVLQNLQYANQVFRERQFSLDGPKAIRALCESLAALNNWRQVSRLTNEESALMRHVMMAILDQLQAFTEKVSWWKPPPGSEALNNFDRLKMMCNMLAELPLMELRQELGAISPPTLSRQRANEGNSNGSFEDLS